MISARRSGPPSPQRRARAWPDRSRETNKRATRRTVTKSVLQSEGAEGEQEKIAPASRIGTTSQPLTDRLPATYQTARKTSATSRSGRSRTAPGVSFPSLANTDTAAVEFFPGPWYNTACLAGGDQVMANSKSAEKRARQNLRRREYNRSVKSSVRTYVKRFETAAANGDREAAIEGYAKAASALDKAVNKGVLHKNMAARKKSRMATKLASLA